jgi:hypothetical protein
MSARIVHIGAIASPTPPTHTLARRRPGTTSPSYSESSECASLRNQNESRTTWRRK